MKFSHTGIIQGLVLLLALLLSACGGGDDTAPTASGAMTVGAAGGTVKETSGAIVIVPAGALSADTTIRIAMDSTGAPALPPDITAAGSTYVITPHGGAFAQPVEVRIPAPNVTLQPNQELKLAKAQPGGQWLVLQNSVLTNGVLSVKVDSFSYFMPVVVSYQLPLVNFPPLQVSASLTCGEQPCGAVTGKVTATYTITTNSGQLPADCPNGSLRIQDGYDRSFGDSYGIETIIPLSGGSRTISLDETTVSYPFYDFVVGLMCSGHRRDLNQGMRIYWATNYPRKMPSILVEPRNMLVTVGQTASLSVQANGVPAPQMIWQSRPANSAGAWTDVSSGTVTTTGNYLTSVTSTYTTPVLTLADNGKQYHVRALNNVIERPYLGWVDSTIVTVSVSDVAIAPSITTQPANINVTAGNDAAFAIAATGTEAMSYQWRFNDTAITGANSPVLLLAAVTNGNAGSYSVDVSNSAGTATSHAATLVVSTGTPAVVSPTIVTQPVSVLVNEGNTATFAVGASANGSLSYQWLRNGQPITGATAAFYSIAQAAVGDAATYAVWVSNNAGGVTSVDVQLTVNQNPQPIAVTITTQPSPQVQLPGGSATFAVAASGSGPISYQWLKGSTPIAGATTAVLTLNNVNGNDAGIYSVTVTNVLNSVTSNAAGLTVPGVPVITSQPANTNAPTGATATFNVTASGSGLHYLWTRNSVAISGATNASYTTPVLTLSDNGAVYGVLVYNGTGIVFSQDVLLTVYTVVTPSVLQQPTDVTIGAGLPANLCMSFGGTAPFNVLMQRWDGAQWVTIGSSIPFNDNNLNCVSTPNLQPADSGAQFHFIASNGGLPDAMTNAVTVTVSAPSVSITTLASMSSAGTVANNASFLPALSATGNLLAFLSTGTNLVAGASNAPTEIGHAYLRNLATGITSMINQRPDGSQSSRGVVGLKLAAGGRYAVFSSLADDLVAGDTNGSMDVFLRDLQTGVTTRLNVLPDGSQITGAGNAVGDAGLGISSDGRWVIFTSFYDLLGNGSPMPIKGLYLYDRQNNALRLVNTGGTYDIQAPAISNDGSAIVYVYATYVPAQNVVMTYDIATSGTTTLFSQDTTTFPEGIGSTLSVSDSGRYVAFTLRSSLWIPGAASSYNQVVVLDKTKPGTLTIASTGSSGDANGHNAYPVLSGDGRYVLFATNAPNLAGDPAATVKPYLMLRDLVAQNTVVASRRPNGTNVWVGGGYGHALSANGAVLGLVSSMFDMTGAGGSDAQVYVAPRP